MVPFIKKSYLRQPCRKLQPGSHLPMQTAILNRGNLEPSQFLNSSPSFTKTFKTRSRMIGICILSFRAAPNISKLSVRASFTKNDIFMPNKPTVSLCFLRQNAKLKSGVCTESQLALKTKIMLVDNIRFSSARQLFTPSCKLSFWALTTQFVLFG